MSGRFYPSVCLPGLCAVSVAWLEKLEQELQSCCRHGAGDAWSEALCGLTWKLCLHFHFWSATGCHETQPDSF